MHDDWDDIVLGGVYQQRGMASFADVLDAEGARAIHTYVIARARHEPTLSERALAWVAGRVCVPALWMAD